jgi:hypothetical protein
MVVEVYIFYTQAHTFRNAKPAAIQDFGHEAGEYLA